MQTLSIESLDMIWMERSDKTALCTMSHNKRAQYYNLCFSLSSGCGDDGQMSKIRVEMKTRQNG